MYKTIIFRLEGVVLNEEILIFKKYELLWHYLRRYPEYREFKQLLSLRNHYASKKISVPPYIRIVQNHLTERDQKRFLYDLRLLEKKMGNRYIRKVPGMRSIIQNLRYYYHIVLLARDSAVTRNAVWKFNWEEHTQYLATGNGGINPSSFRDRLLQIIDNTRAQPKETLLISENYFPDIQVARQSGITPLMTNYSFRTKGFSPQSIREREYVASIEDEDDRGLLEMFRKEMKPASGIYSPQELVKKIERLEENQPDQSDYEKMSGGSESFWDLAKKLINPPMDYPDE